jgi:hypothetical protein
MKKHTRILVAITFFLGLGVAAEAATRAQTTVTLPFDFVVTGKTLPAGVYTVSNDIFGVLLLTSRDQQSSVYVNPVDVETASVNMPKLTFRRVGGQYFLSAIQTSNDVYNIPVSPSAILEVSARSHGNSPVSGTSGGN